MYLNGQLVQQESFTVEGGTGLVLEDGEPDNFPDMYEAYDFDNLDIFFVDGYEDDYWYYYDDLYYFEDFTDDWYYFYEALWWDYGYDEDEWYWYCDPDLYSSCGTEYSFSEITCDPALDPGCAAFDYGSDTFCDPEDPYCETSDYTCDPDLDPDCAGDGYNEEDYTDEDNYEYDYYEEDPPPDDYYCDPDFDPECAVVE